MNNPQRASLTKIREQLEDLGGRIEDIAAEIRDRYENMTEAVQDSDAGQKLQAEAEALEDISASCMTDGIDTALED